MCDFVWKIYVEVNVAIAVASLTGSANFTRIAPEIDVTVVTVLAHVAMAESFIN